VQTHQINVIDGRARVWDIRRELFAFLEVLDVFVTSRPDALVVICAGRRRRGEWVRALARPRLRRAGPGRCRRGRARGRLGARRAHVRLLDNATMEPQDLYGLPLERFTHERNALAKQLRAERRREEAVEVAALPKPTVEAWAANQLARTQRRELEALFAAGERLARAQADLLAGHGDPRALREAVEAERTAVAQLTERARGLLSLQGRELSAAVLERVSETLHAAALDEDARAQVRDGCLKVGLRHIGLGTVAASSPSRSAAPPQAAAPPRAKPRSAPRADDGAPRAADGGPRPDAKTEQRAVQREAAKREAARLTRERAAALKAARRRETDSRREMQRVASAMQSAEQERDAAAAALADAESALAGARERARRAAEDHRRAQAALDQL
jgi:hypothetical protein